MLKIKLRKNVDLTIPKILKIVLGNELEKNHVEVYQSNSAVQIRISNRTFNIMDQIEHKKKSAVSIFNLT